MGEGRRGESDVCRGAGERGPFPLKALAIKEVGKLWMKGRVRELPTGSDSR